MILLAEDVGEWWAPATTECFLCGTRVDPPGVYWVAGSNLLLHPDCATCLGQHLIADAREAQLASGRPPWASRVTRAALAAIEVKS